MPVVITGPWGQLGSHVVEAFLKTSPQVRVHVRHHDVAEDLRNLGAKVSIGDVLDVDQLEAVMSGAHTVCHLGSEPTGPNEETWQSTTIASMEAVVHAATAAGIRR